MTTLQLICTFIVASFVLIRCVCVMNLMSRKTPLFIWLLYLADGVAAVGILWQCAHAQPPTDIESLIISSIGFAFAFDPRMKPRALAAGGLQPC